MTLLERGLAEQTVSLSALLSGERPPVAGRTHLVLSDYVQEILSSGFPGLRGLPQRLREAQLDGYLERIVDRDFEELGRKVRRPATLLRWMRAYAAAISTTAIEVKLGEVVEDRDVRHLLWLRQQLGDDLTDAIVLTSGSAAYRRPDGIAVVPVALLGP